MNRAWEQEHLDQAYRHIAELKAHIVRQRVFLKDALDNTGSRTCRLFGHTTYDLSSMYWMITGNARSFWPGALLSPPPNLTPKPSMVPPSDRSTESAALRSALASKPPYFLMAVLGWLGGGLVVCCDRTLGGLCLFLPSREIPGAGASQRPGKLWFARLDRGAKRLAIHKQYLSGAFRRSG